MALLLGLPDECLVHVMRQLAGEPRSQLAAARACTRLRHAAAAALDSMAIAKALNAARQDSVQRYLGQHGQHVTSISIGSYCQGELDLALAPACTRLRALDVSRVGLHLGGHQGALQTATSLTRLQLEACNVLDGAGSAAAALGALRGLRQLDWRHSTLPGNAALPGGFLSSLMQLTRLQMVGYKSLVRDDTLQHLGCLTNLLELDVSGGQLTDAAFTGLQQLQRLTTLNVCELQLCVGTGSTAAISALTRLQQLHAEDCVGFEPACLAGASQLQVLQLDGTRVAGGPDGVAVFLAQLAGLQQLQELELNSTLPDCAPAVGAYSGLTASSHLTRLWLTNCELPEGVWQHVFQHTRLLPNLLALEASFEDDEDVLNLMAADDVDSLVTCCPGLQRLDLCVQPSSQVLAPLVRLSALTQLCVAGTSDAAVVGAPLSQLTGLQSLLLCGDNRHMRSGATLLHLTALQQLTRLAVSLAAPEEDEDEEEDEDATMFEAETREGQPPDVADQLLQHCLEQHTPCPVPLSLLARQAQRLAVQEQQLAEQAQQLTQQGQQVARQEQQLAVMAAAQAAEAAELHGRLARLEQVLTGRPAAAGAPGGAGGR